MQVYLAAALTLHLPLSHIGADVGQAQLESQLEPHSAWNGGMAESMLYRYPTPANEPTNILSLHCRLQLLPLTLQTPLSHLFVEGLQ